MTEVERGESDRSVAQGPAMAEGRSAQRMLGRYRLASKLGTGGTANVFLAVTQADYDQKKLAVLKVPHDDIALDASLRLMFLDEARLAARLHHPNVVRTDEVLEDDERTILVMEYVDGFSLAQLLTESRRTGRSLPLALHLRILTDVLAGLDYAHELTDGQGNPLGLVHRDISPQNILVTMDGQVKIVDFGIAKAANASHVTARGNFKGKIRYMPPEQLRGRPVDRRADVFAVGAILWDIVVGRPLWDRVPDINVMGALMGGNLPQIRQRKPDVDPALAAILDRALAFEPTVRHPTALAMKEDIDRVLDRGLAARRAQTREIGAWMNALFAEEHAARTRALADLFGPGLILGDRFLAADDRPTSMGGITVTPAFARSEPASLSPASVSHPVPGHPARVRVSPRTLGRWAFVAAGGALCLFFAIALVRDAVRPDPPAAASAPPPPAAVLDASGHPRTDSPAPVTSALTAPSAPAPRPRVPPASRAIVDAAAPSSTAPPPVVPVSPLKSAIESRK